MPFTPFEWQNLPTELDPLPDETVADWLGRIHAYDLANPGTLTLLDAAALIDAETRVTDYADSAAAAAIVGLAPLASPALSGNPTAPTPTLGDDDTSIATTAFVQAALAGAGGGDPVLTWTNFTYGTFWRTAPDDWFTGETIAGGAHAKDASGIVYLDGQVSPTSGTTVGFGTGDLTNLITTLPAGKRPATLKRFVVPAYVTHSEFFQFMVQIYPGGEVRLANYFPFGSAGSTSAPTMNSQLELTLSGIHFRAA